MVYQRGPSGFAGKDFKNYREVKLKSERITGNWSGITRHKKQSGEKVTGLSLS
jgi:hypothetical protein